ncbi:E1 ubiquitin-activating protein uba2 [Dimargaris cristalligena]|nr:E1 ubiquitin-activating protein uba2 [Dimargaris cristalligena]
MSAETRVLVVGAGGIGCELLKNLVLSGFLDIHVVDLDTIDLSNLNRQFLFQRCHIGQSKAQVAAAAVRRFNPNARVTPYHDNIMHPKFDARWFARFDLVLNALDNLEARRYVNRLCLVTNRPLLESGTAGYQGQVTVIHGGRTECFDCQPKPVPVTFPICTIRSTPSTPIHCIVWAKDYLFSQLFGFAGDGDEDSTTTMTQTTEGGSDNAEEIRNLQLEATALKRLRLHMLKDTFAREVFQKVFDHDIRRLLSMEDMWATRTKPTPMTFPTGTAPATGDPAAEGRGGGATGLAAQRVWDQAETIRVFSDSIARLARRFAKLTGRLDPTTDDGTLPEAALSETGMSFDKDDPDMLDFVTATANLRSLVFHIAPQSQFDVKAMAGNIIPAIATTNAVIAGLIALQANTLRRCGFGNANHLLPSCQTTYLVQDTTRPRLLYNEKLAAPSPTCATCRRRYAVLEVDPTRATLGDFLKLAQKYATQLLLGDDLIIEEGGRILYDPDFDDNLDRTFADLGLGTNQTVSLTSEDTLPPYIWPVSFWLVATTTTTPTPEDNDQLPPLVLTDPSRLEMSPGVAAAHSALANSPESPPHPTQLAIAAAAKRKADTELVPDQTKIAKAQEKEEEAAAARSRSLSTGDFRTIVLDADRNAEKSRVTPPLTDEFIILDD